MGGKRVGLRWRPSTDGVYILTTEERYRDYIRTSIMRWVLMIDLFPEVHSEDNI